MQGLSEIVTMYHENRLGFRADEVMKGTHRFEPGRGPEGDHPMSFTVTWGPRDIAQWINPWREDFLHQELSGTVTVGGLCHEAPCQGTLDLLYFSEHKIRYTFSFEAGGRQLRFVGEKVNIKPWNLPFSHTTCFGTITEEASGALISRSETYFHLSTAPQFLWSFRLA